VLSLVHVPTEYPLDAELPDQEARALSAIERAKLICGQRISGEIEHVRPGQAGAVVVEEAKQIDAAVILMPIRYRDGKPQLSKSIEHVLAKRPCRVILAAHPGGDGAVEAPRVLEGQPVTA
jgi:hypothetical protein